MVVPHYVVGIMKLSALEIWRSEERKKKKEARDPWTGIFSPVKPSNRIRHCY